MTRWEKLLGLDGIGTIEQRRIKLISKASAQNKRSLPGLTQILKSLCSSDADVCEVILDISTLSLKVNLECSPDSYSEINDLIHNSVPANLAVDFAVHVCGNSTLHIAHTAGVFLSIASSEGELPEEVSS